MDIRLRPATAADVDRITELVRAAYGRYLERMGRPPRPYEQDYAQVVRAQDVTVAEEEGRIVGLLVMDDDPDEGYVIDNVAVDPARHGRGVGRTLLELGERKARERGLGEIRLYTHSTMTENLALYARIGYVEYGRVASPPGEVVLLRKPLG